MTPETRSLAERLARHPRFAWAEGMLDDYGDRCGDHNSDGDPVEMVAGFPPDLDDPATAGCLWEMLRAAHGRQPAGHPARVYAYNEHVQVMGGENPHGKTPAFYVDAPSLGAACAEALLAVWGETP